MAGPRRRSALQKKRSADRISIGWASAHRRLHPVGQGPPYGFFSSSRRRPGSILTLTRRQKWIPAFAGMTDVGSTRFHCSSFRRKPESVSSALAHESPRAGSPLPRDDELLSYQCTPRMSDANAICSLVGAAISWRPAIPFAAAESGNSRNAVFMTISYARGASE